MKGRYTFGKLSLNLKAINTVGEKPTEAFKNIKHFEKHFTSTLNVKKISVFVSQNLNLRSVTAMF